MGGGPDGTSRTGRLRRRWGSEASSRCWCWITLTFRFWRTRKVRNEDRGQRTEEARKHPQGLRNGDVVGTPLALLATLALSPRSEPVRVARRSEQNLKALQARARPRSRPHKLTGPSGSSWTPVSTMEETSASISRSDSEGLLGSGSY